MAQDWANRNAPGIQVIELLAQEALEALPEFAAEPARRIRINVADFASEEVLDSVGIEDGLELTGHYEGIPLVEKSYSDQPTAIDSIWLYRLPILFEWAERGDVALGDLVAHIVVHEIAHHFGWSDEDIAKIDKWWE